MRGDRPVDKGYSREYQQFTPHARGSTEPPPSSAPVRLVYPACAGIDLPTERRLAQVNRLPRMRGDRPGEGSSLSKKGGFTPHARGSTLFKVDPVLHGRVYPACAGIDLRFLGRSERHGSLPRMRGDRPATDILVIDPATFTPHARGSTVYPTDDVGSTLVYPACAGIDHRVEITPPKRCSLPRMRGDRPALDVLMLVAVAFTPHARGSTLCPGKLKLTQGVYPACAGIDPAQRTNMGADLCLPRMRGDRPAPEAI